MHRDRPPRDDLGGGVVRPEIETLLAQISGVVDQRPAAAQDMQMSLLRSATQARGRLDEIREASVDGRHFSSLTTHMRGYEDLSLGLERLLHELAKGPR